MRAALDVKHVQQVFHPDIMGSERRRVIARELWRRPRDCANGIAIRRRVDQDDAIGVLQRLQQRKPPVPPSKHSAPAGSVCFSISRTT